MDILTTAAQNYMTTFSGYVTQFFQWGQWLFFGLLVINIVWIALWNAFDKNSLAETMPSFIRRFFIISFFYTLMMNPSWLMDMLKTAQVMGFSLTHVPIDPSSLISEGIGIGNLIIIPIEKSSLLTLGFGLIIISIVYLVVLFVFISIALELALTLIITTALISVASFFLGFAALGATTQIARQTLDIILANCVKLLGIYLVVAAGSQTITMVTNSIPTTITTFDPYAWIVAVAFLFWLLAKNLPNLLARFVSGAIDGMRGTDAAALGMSAIGYAQTAMPAINIASGAAQSIARLVGSTAFNAGAHFNKATSSSGDLALGLGAAVGGSMMHLGRSVGGNVADHFKSVASKMAGGSGTQQPISSISERMYQAAKDMKQPESDVSKSGPGNPNSAGRTSAAPSSTRSEPKEKSISRPKK